MKKKASILQINLIDSAKKSLKLSKFTSGSLVGSVNFPLDQISKPKMDSNQLEFNVKGPVNVSLGVELRPRFSIENNVLHLFLDYHVVTEAWRLPQLEWEI